MSTHTRDEATVLRVCFDPCVHSEQALLRACYSLDHLGIFRIERESERFVVYCTLRAAVEDAEARLRSAAVDFSVRESVETRTGELRNLIWRTAFAEASGIEHDDRSDPSRR